MSLSNDDLSESEQSLDFFRANDAAPSVTPPASHESFSLLNTSQDHSPDSVLMSPLKDVEATCSDAAAVDATQPQEPVSSGSPEGAGRQDTGGAVSEKAEGFLQSQDPADEKGILEQSQITLASLTDTSLLDQDPTLTDEAASWGEEDPDVVRGSADWSREGLFILGFYLSFC